MPAIFANLFEKGKKKERLVVLLLIGLLLMVVVWPDSGTNTALSSEDAGTAEGNGETAQETQRGTDAAEEYAAYLEERLAACLSEMEGVGEVTVFVTMKNAGEEVLAKDKSSTSSENESGEETDKESQTSEETVYADDEDGQSPYVVKELTPLVRGVLVVADGGDDPVVQQNISEAVEALFSIEAHKIKVVRRKEG